MNYIIFIRYIITIYAKFLRDSLCNCVIFLGKEARKKELKKNKRQRMAVRAAVLKGKDPTQLIVEMEKMDQMG